MRRLLLCLALPLLAAGVSAQDFIRYYPPQLGTTSAGAFTLSGPLLLPDGAAAAPSYSFANDTDKGFYSHADNILAYARAGVVPLAVLTTSLNLNSSYALGWSSGIAATTAADTTLFRDAANTLALRNGGTAGSPVPQAFNVYNFCDGAACATGYERGFMRFNANVLEVGFESAGTGTASRIVRMVASTGAFQLYSNSNLLSFDGTSFYPVTTDARNNGGPSNLWMNVYAVRSIQGSKSKSLTDAAAAVSFVRIAVPTNANMGGKLIYTATSTDGGNGSLTSTAEYNFSGADDDGVVTCGISAQLGVATAYARANTLLCTVTTVTSTTNCDLQVTCTDDKAAAQTITFNWRLDMPIPNTVTPQ